jgi:hypothetical protein
MESDFSWTPEQEASFVQIMTERRCTRPQAIRLFKRGNPKPVPGDDLIPPSPEVKRFANDHQVRAKRDECGELIIPGRVGHVYEHGASRYFGILLMLDTRQQWTWAKKKLVSAGFTIRQDGDTEGSALFDPENAAQVAVALELARIKRRRVMSQEQRIAAAERLALIRKAAA